VWDHLLRWTPNIFHPDGQEISVSCIGKYLVAVCQVFRADASKICQCYCAFYPLHAIDIIRPLLLDVRLWLLHLIFTTWLYLRRHVETIHYIDRGLAAISTGNIRCPCLENKNMSRVASSSCSPVYVFEHLYLRAGHTLSYYSSRCSTSFCSTLWTTLGWCILSNICRALSETSPRLLSTFGAPLNGSTHRRPLCSTATPNSSSSSWPITHPSIMPRIVRSYPSVECRCYVVRCAISQIQTKLAVIVCQHCSTLHKRHYPSAWPKIWAWRWPV